MITIQKVGIVLNPTIPSAHQVAAEVEAILGAAGVEALPCPDSLDPEVWTHQDGLDMILAFGGDGTILRAARLAAPLHIPLLGINLGRVGFLSEIGPTAVAERIPQVLEGHYWVERRSMLHAELWRTGARLHSFDALNDIVASRASLSRVVDCTLIVNGQKVTTYVADGVILATPTGSTAYSMAAGGPILHPELRSIVVTPIAPYLTIIRSLILPDDSQIELDITTDDAAYLTVDGQQHVLLEDGDAVRITTSPTPSLFARLQPRSYFAATLAQRLQRKDG
ncbi:MAG TPA: NAD(+)/NADH kinase [Chloroflexia bacterium]|nr:NAD(+)/NADH kinase [Chloroflexia bacterium]